jgi:hypothetical protein
MDYDELNKELSASRNNTSDWVKAMNDKIWHEILSGFANGDIPEDYQVRGYRENSPICDDFPAAPQDAVESLMDKTRPVYHDYGVTLPASAVASLKPSIFVSPWVYHEIQAVLAECEEIERVENAKKTRWARLRKIDKMRRKEPQPVYRSVKCASPLGLPFWSPVYATWIS